MTRDLIRRRPALSGMLIWGIAVLVGLGVLWIAVGYAQSEADKTTRSQITRQYDNAVKGCERANLLRIAINERIISTQREFLKAAEAARRSSALQAATLAERKTNAKAAARYRALAKISRPLDLIDCAAAYPKP